MKFPVISIAFLVLSQVAGVYSSSCTTTSPGTYKSTCGSKHFVESFRCQSGSSSPSVNLDGTLSPKTAVCDTSPISSLSCAPVRSDDDECTLENASVDVTSGADCLRMEVSNTRKISPNMYVEAYASCPTGYTIQHQTCSKSTNHGNLYLASKRITGNKIDGVFYPKVAKCRYSTNYFTALQGTATTTLLCQKKQCDADDDSSYNVIGGWQYVMQFSDSSTNTIEASYGSTKSEAYTQTSEWSQNVTETVEAGLSVESIGLDVTASLSVSTSTSIASTDSQFWEMSETKSYLSKWDTDVASKVLWQWGYTILDNMGNNVTTTTHDFALTDCRDQEPRCLPGNIVNNTSSQECSNDNYLPFYNATSEATTCTRRRNLRGEN